MSRGNVVFYNQPVQKIDPVVKEHPLKINCLNATLTAGETSVCFGQCSKLKQSSSLKSLCRLVFLWSIVFRK